MSAASIYSSNQPPGSGPAGETPKKLTPEEINALIPDFSCAEEYFHYLFFRPDINPFLMPIELLKAFMSRYGHWHDLEDQLAAIEGRSIRSRLANMIRRFYQRETKRSGLKYARFGCYVVVVFVGYDIGQIGQNMVLRTTTKVYIKRFPYVLRHPVCTVGF